MIDGTYSTTFIPRHIPTECITLQKEKIKSMMMSLYKHHNEGRMTNGRFDVKEESNFRNIHIVGINSSLTMCMFMHTNIRDSKIFSIYSLSTQDFDSSGSIADFNASVDSTAYDFLQDTSNYRLHELQRDIDDLLLSVGKDEYSGIEINKNIIAYTITLANLWPNNCPVPSLSICDEGNLNLYTFDDEGFVIFGLEITGEGKATYIIYDNERNIADIGKLDLSRMSAIEKFFTKISDLRMERFRDNK